MVANIIRLKARGVHAEFLDGKSKIDKAGKPFSSTGINQVHYQYNNLVRIDGRAAIIF